MRVVNVQTDEIVEEDDDGQLVYTAQEAGRRMARELRSRRGGIPEDVETVNDRLLRRAFNQEVEPDQAEDEQPVRESEHAAIRQHQMAHTRRYNRIHEASSLIRRYIANITRLPQNIHIIQTRAALNGLVPSHGNQEGDIAITLSRLQIYEFRMNDDDDYSGDWERFDMERLNNPDRSRRRARALSGNRAILTNEEELVELAADAIRESENMAKPTPRKRRAKKVEKKSVIKHGTGRRIKIRPGKTPQA